MRFVRAGGAAGETTLCSGDAPTRWLRSRHASPVKAHRCLCTGCRDSQSSTGSLGPHYALRAYDMATMRYHLMLTRFQGDTKEVALKEANLKQ